LLLAAQSFKKGRLPKLCLRYLFHDILALTAKHQFAEFGKTTEISGSDCASHRYV
jgi:hypothetical protein